MRSFLRLFWLHGEVEFDVVAVTDGLQDAAPGGEADFVAGGLTLLPEGVRRGQGSERLPRFKNCALASAYRAIPKR
jgi:hypothetical protein